MPLEVDASNSCIPPSHSLIALTPPLPTTTRGEPVILDGNGGSFNADRSILVYPSGRLVVVRDLDSDLEETEGTSKRVRAFVYRGHTAQVTCAKFSPSGYYVASADVRGKLRVWSYDNEEHLCKLELSSALMGPIRDLAWDCDSKRIILVGEGSKADASSLCSRVIQWDSGVKVGDLAQHARNRATTCAVKPNRPMRIVTGGGEDSSCYFHAGPPFARVIKPEVSEKCHTRGSVHCVRYNSDGTRIASVGTDKSVCVYDGKTMALIHRLENIHTASIYSCAWSSDGFFLLTCSADGTVKLVSTESWVIVHTWDVTKLANVGGKGNGRESPSSSIPIGSIQLGCAFTKQNIPVSIGFNGQIRILPLPSELSNSDNVKIPTMKVLTGHRSPISSLAINHTAGVMYTADSDGCICKWDVQSNSAITNVQRAIDTSDDCERFDSTFMNKVHSGAITSLICGNDGTLLSIGWDDKIRFSLDAILTKSTQLDAQPNSIAKGTSLIAVLTVKGIVLLKNNDIISDLIPLDYEALSICVSSNDQTVYVGGQNCNIHIYQVSDETLTLQQTLGGAHLKPIYSLALSNDGTKLASGDARDVCVWDVADNLAPLVGRSRWCFHQQRINALAWSKDDSILASGGNDDSIYLWNLKKKATRVHYNFAHRGGITSLAFLKNTNGTVLVSTGNDGCVNQWDVAIDVMQKFG